MGLLPASNSKFPYNVSLQHKNLQLAQIHTVATIDKALYQRYLGFPELPEVLYPPTVP